jgi:hypothetical protein
MDQSPGQKTDLFEPIAGLLYEVASGQKGTDLKRACDEALCDPMGRWYRTAT